MKCLFYTELTTTIDYDFVSAPKTRFNAVNSIDEKW